MPSIEFNEAIKVIPGEEGFWTGSSEDTYLEKGQLLVNKGFTEEEALRILKSLYWGAAACYGS